ncbi:MAG: hypothetical protein AVO33_09195, partial [delta proteobacterium ML8_F1]
MKKQALGEGKKSLSIRTILLVLFLLILSMAVVGNSHIIISNWRSSSEKTTLGMARDLNERIHEDIHDFMETPRHMNLLNHKVIATGILDLSETTNRERYFLGVLQTYEDHIYSFSFGSVHGEYYGARRSPDGVLEIMRNDASTGGVSWYYEVREDLTAGDRVVVAGAFDPRTRDWYRAAQSKGAFTFSPVYQHFVMDDLAISASIPVYSPENDFMGVLGAHLLLSGINDYLETIAEDSRGFAYIYEKDSGLMIGNSIGVENFRVEADGSYVRNSYRDIEKALMEGSSGKVNSSQGTENLEATYAVNTEIFEGSGLEWVVVSGIARSLLSAEVNRTINFTIGFVILMGLFTLGAYSFSTKVLLDPIANLLEVSEKIASGDLSQRAEVSRMDEIGRISIAFNNVAESLQSLINDLEGIVARRTEELHGALEDRQRSADQLRLLLDSTAEAIYGVDTEGRCTFTNTSCLKMLGYSSEESLIGRNMHNLIHYQKKDGTPLPRETCEMDRAFKEGKKTHAEDEVFWRSDGTFFEVEYYSYPQYRGENLVGAVVNFMDITSRKKDEEQIRYLSYHDELTGLKNRRYVDEQIRQYALADKIPFSVIIGDINGLKMTNDIFGHGAGDNLIKKSAQIIRQSTREKDTIARIGGDEFLVLLPDTGKEETGQVIKRINQSFSEATIDAIKCSISLGSDTRLTQGKSLEETMTNAENAMYKEKTLKRNDINQHLIKTLMETLHRRSKEEEAHSQGVAELSGKIARALGLDAAAGYRMEKAGYHHDIGKIVLSEELLHKRPLSEVEKQKMKNHSVVGYRILNLFDETLDIAEGVYSHHEWFNGEGYPKGLKGEEIPMMARILAVAEVYDRMVNPWGALPLSHEEAVSEIGRLSGTY